MTTIRKDIDLEVPAAKVWDVIRDIAAVHTRLAPGFVVDTQIEPGARVVTFANGVVVRERIVDVNDELRRLAYSASGDRLPHHNASFEVIALPNERTRVAWTTDVLPHEAADIVRPLIEQGSVVMSKSLGALGR